MDTGANGRGVASRLRPGRRPSLWTGLYALTFLVLAVGVPVLYSTRALHVDEVIYLVVGQLVGDGSRLYVDIIDHKPPGVFYLVAAVAAVAAEPHLPLRALTYAVTAATALLVLRLGQRHYGTQVGMVASLLVLVGSYLPHFDGHAFLTEQYLGLCTVVAATFVLSGRGRRADVAAGVALGVGALFNQAVFLFGAVVTAYLLAGAGTAPSSARFRQTVATGRRLLTISLGFAIPTGLALAYFAWLEQAGALIEYVFVVPLTSYDPPFNGPGHVSMLLSFAPVWLLATLGVAVSVAQFVRTRQATVTLFVTLWAVMLAYPGLTQFSGDHKMLYAFPAVSLLAALSLRWLWAAPVFSRPAPTVADGGAVTPGPRLGAVAAVLLLVVAGSVAFNVVYASTTLDESIADQRVTADALSAYATGPVYAFPFDYAPVYLSEGMAASDIYIGSIYSAELAAAVIADLDSSEIRYVIVRRVHVQPDGSLAGAGYFADSEAIVAAYIDDRYRPVGEVGQYVVYERRG